MMRKKVKAFTLIELMVVMIIMIILFAITLPALLKVQYSKPVGHSTHKLQAVLIHARSLAARHQTNYSVTFNTWNASHSIPAGGNTVATMSYNGKPQNYYEIYAHRANGKWPGFTAKDYEPWTFDKSFNNGDIVIAPDGYLYKCTGGTKTSYNVAFHTDEALHTDRPGCTGDAITCNAAHPCGQHGDHTWTRYNPTTFKTYQTSKRYYLNSGVEFMAFSFVGSNGDLDYWNGMNYGWGSRGYITAEGQFRIIFTPTSEAFFRVPWNTSGLIHKDGAENGIFQTIALCKEGDRKVCLRVVVNRYSGDITIQGKE